MSRKHDDYIASLHRRRDRLDQRLAREWTGSEEGFHATRRERAALVWAITLLETAKQTGDLEWLEKAGVLAASGDDSQRRVEALVRKHMDDLMQLVVVDESAVNGGADPDRVLARLIVEATDATARLREKGLIE